MLPNAAAPRTGVGEEKQPHQWGESGLRRPRPAAPMGTLARLHAPLLLPSDAAVHKTMPRVMPQVLPGAAAPRTWVGEEQQPRQRDAPGLRRPQFAVLTGALSQLRAPLLVPSDAAVRGTKPGEKIQATPSAAAPRTGIREYHQPHQRGESGLRRPPPAACTGASAQPHAPLLVPSDAAVHETMPREVP